ncbi:MAG: hypothetical protein ABJF23_06600 [Bryobacteraceae bacterium]
MMKYPALLLAFCAVLSAETFPARLERPLWPDQDGTVEINDQGIAYSADNKKQSLGFAWPDIQYFDRVSPNEFVVLTYKDQRLLMGRDREYRFIITQGELSDALFAMISNHLKRPVTDRVPPGKIATVYTVPVKRNRGLGGSEGELEFTRNAIYYVTKNKSDGRTWFIDRDIVAVWSDDPYRLEIRAYENNRREFSRTATYKFDLKEKLDPEFYRKLKLKLYGLETNNEVIR